MGHFNTSAINRPLNVCFNFIFLYFYYEIHSDCGILKSLVNGFRMLQNEIVCSLGSFNTLCIHCGGDENIREAPNEFPICTKCVTEKRYLKRSRIESLLQKNDNSFYTSC